MEREAKPRISEDQSSLGLLIQKALGNSFVSRSLKAISILREVNKELSQIEANSDLCFKIEEAISILGNEEDIVSKNNESFQSEDLGDTLTFLKTFSSR